MALECPICFELYNLKERKPKSLRCSHSICSECLVKLCQSDSVECPTCRRTTKPDEININYGLVDVVAEQCEECVKEKRARKCHHCNQELCMHCFSAHARAYNAEVNKELYNLRKELRHAIEKSMDRSLLDRERQKEVESLKTMKKNIQARRNELDELEKTLELELRRVNESNVTKIKEWMSSIDAEVDKCKDFVLSCEDKIKSQYTSGCTTEELVKLSAEAKKFSMKLQRMQNDTPSISDYKLELKLHPQFASDSLVTIPNHQDIISNYKNIANKIIEANHDVEQLKMTKPEVLNSQLLVQDPKPLTSAMLTRLLNQKQVLGEQLFPLIQTKHPDLAGKITGMLLELDNIELLNMLDSREVLDAKVQEAVMVLKAHQAKQTVAHQTSSQQDEPTAAHRPIQSAPMNSVKPKVSARLAMSTILKKTPGLSVADVIYHH